MPSLTRLQPKPTEIELFTIHDRLAAYDGYNPSLVLLPVSADGQPDLAAATPDTCEPLPNDDWPEDPATAARVAILVDRIPGISPETAFLVHTANGAPEATLLSGPAGEATIGESLIRFHALNEAPARPRGPLAASFAKLAGKYEAANDNARPTQPQPQPGPQVISSADFVKGFRPPDYHIDGIIQRGFIYSLTASTGTGKTAIALLVSLLTERGKALAGREVTQGRVVYFAGENPDDVAMRWIGICHDYGLDPAELDVHFITERFSIPKAIEAIRRQVETLGGAGLIIVDTSAAYFQGDDENGNTALGAHARDLRALTTLPGRPCVIVPCHPTKNAANDNLLPRGGGAFIAEMDGNLTLTRSGEAVRLHWQGKHRGADFAPLSFRLATVTAPQLVDSKGRSVPTVMAVALDDGEVRDIRQQERRDEDEALLHIENGRKSHTAIAEAAGWRDKDGNPHKRRSQAACEKLKAAKLVVYQERIGWKLTQAGIEAAQAVRADMQRVRAAEASIRAMMGADE